MKRVICLAIALAPVSHAAARDAREKTWARSRVSYGEYRKDSVDCAYIGYYRDISQDQPAVKFVTGWRAGDNALNTPGGNGDSWGAAIGRTQPDRKMAEIRKLQTSDVEACLVQRGYRLIDLSPTEAKTLSKFKKGSEARHRYLYSIATR